MLNLEESNQYLINLINQNEPFLITRLGIGAETMIIYDYLQKKRDNSIPAIQWHNSSLTHTINVLSNNAGIYGIDKHNLTLYCQLYLEAIEKSNALACFQNTMIDIPQTLLVQKYRIDTLYSRILEPFYCCLENITPWSHSLLGKKVLIVSPFTDSIKKQLNADFQIFKDKRIFKEGQEFVFYKSYQSIAGNHPHQNWLETYTIMCREIKNLDFDIALLGCGGYGLPLCNYIHKNLKRSSIYVGGGLQLLFGVMGKRWTEIPLWKKIIEENDTKFIRPSGTEICSNLDRVEGGCYW